MLCAWRQEVAGRVPASRRHWCHVRRLSPADTGPFSVLMTRPLLDSPPESPARPYVSLLTNWPRIPFSSRLRFLLLALQKTWLPIRPTKSAAVCSDSVGQVVITRIGDPSRLTRRHVLFSVGTVRGRRRRRRPRTVPALDRRDV